MGSTIPEIMKMPGFGFFHNQIEKLQAQADPGRRVVLAAVSEGLRGGEDEAARNNSEDHEGRGGEVLRTDQARPEEDNKGQRALHLWRCVERSGGSARATLFYWPQRIPVPPG